MKESRCRKAPATAPRGQRGESSGRPDSRCRSLTNTTTPASSHPSASELPLPPQDLAHHPRLPLRQRPARLDPDRVAQQAFSTFVVRHQLLRPPDADPIFRDDGDALDGDHDGLHHRGGDDLEEIIWVCQLGWVWEGRGERKEGRVL